MRLALVMGGGVGCGVLPALIAALRRRGWALFPAGLPAAEVGLGPVLLHELCGAAPTTVADLPPVDVTVVAPCAAHLLTAWQALPTGGPRFSSPVVVVPVVPAATVDGGAAGWAVPDRPGWRCVPPSQPLLGGGVTNLFTASPEAVCETVAASVALQDLAGSAVLVSAGPTCEDLDPVRFLSNRSSGLMGVALALAAWRRGATVTLVHGPLQLDIPCLPGLLAVPVRSAREMHAAVMARSVAPTAKAPGEACGCGNSVAILCAAVADFTPARYADHKIKKSGGAGRLLELVQTADILAALGALPGRPFLVGFAAETRELQAHAVAKLHSKNCDLLCANDVTEPGSGFGVATNRLTLFARDGSVTPLPLLPKAAAAERVLDRVVADLRAQRLSP
jgi:hypothetical protein